MRQFLQITLYAPLAATGDIAVGTNRPGQLIPARSALLGLAAAALGIDRYDEPAHQALSDSLSLSILVLNPGVPLVDFHTIQTPGQKKGVRHYTRTDELRNKERLNTIVSLREYLCDVAYVIFFEATATPVYELETLKQAFLKPHYALYLGRRSCPLGIALNPQLVAAPDLAAAIKSLDRNTLNKFLQPVLTADTHGGEERRVLLLTEHKPDGLAVKRVSRRDEVLSRRRWQFGEREYWQQIIATGESSDVSEQD